MSHIVTSSESLDQIFEYKRNQVDKLVRVRRLLNRLEFLSELPERLAAMIDHKLYKDAVQLYNKTISVLTRHSHVLSFKKIKVLDLTSYLFILFFHFAFYFLGKNRSHDG